MATSASARNGRDSNPQYLGVKAYDGQFLTAEEAAVIQPENILKLMTSELGRRLAESPAVHREQPFNLLMEHDPDGSGLTDFTFGARYAVLPEMVNIFLDLNIPFGDEGEGGYIGSDEWAIYFGGQFYKELIPQLLLGVEAGLDWGFEHNDFERGLVFNTGAEIGYTIKEIGLTPFAGIEFKYKLTDDEWNGAGAWEDNAGDNQFNLWIGAAYAINEAMAVDGKIKMRSGDIDGDATHFDVNFSYNF